MGNQHSLQKNKVYYGEYSLKHWIELIFKGKISLPPYQRIFVWEKERVEFLIDSFKNDEFIPPVTIGSFNEKNEDINDYEIKNLILDGQQRLTSLLLAYLGVYPNKEKFKKKAEQSLLDVNDDEEDESDTEILDWSFRNIVEIAKNKSDFDKKYDKNFYDKLKLDYDLGPDFWENNYLGFSYLIPKSNNNKKQKKYYSSVFRHINIQGVPLLDKESREALYYLEDEYTRLFKPNFEKNLWLKSEIDFVRYLAFLSNYKENGASNDIAKGYKKKIEKYYMNYIYSVVDSQNNKSDESDKKKADRFCDFISVFKDMKTVDNRIEKLDSFMNELLSLRNKKSMFSIIIEVDVYLFGAIYHILFEGCFDKEFDISNINELSKDLENKIAHFKRNDKHIKSPNDVSHLRKRIDSSIEIYNKYYVRNDRGVINE